MIASSARAPLARQHLLRATHPRRLPPFLPSRPQGRRPAVAAAAVISAEPQQLASWLAARGADPKQAAPGCAVGEGGLVAARPVKKDEQLYSIPDSCWITAATVAASPIGAAVAGQPPWLQLALFLLHERSKPASEWGPYLASLPAEPGSPVLWSDEELAELAGSQLLGIAQGYRSFFASKYAELQGSVFAAAPALFPPSAFGFEAFLWAVVTVRARVHAPLEGEQVALVPFADLTQHRRAAAAGQWAVKKAGLFGGSFSLVMEAGRDLAAGAPVGMDYGPGKSDSQVLVDYGVLDSSSPQPGFALTLELAESERYFDDKMDILEINGLAQSVEFILRPDETPSATLLAFLRLLGLQGADSFLLESLFRNDVWGHLQLPVSEENEQAVYQTMIDGCAAALRGYATSIDEDLALLKGGGLAPGSRAELAVRARLGEKEVLDATLRYFEDRIGRLGGQEYYAERRLKGLGLLDDQGNTTWDGFFKDSIA